MANAFSAAFGANGARSGTGSVLRDTQTGQSFNVGGSTDPRFQTASGSSSGGWSTGGQRYTMPAEAGDMNPTGAAQDPFAYTNGSLLTPWTKTFQAPTSAPSSSGGGQAGGPAPAAAPGFDFAFGGYSAPSVGNFELGDLFSAPGQPFRGGRLAAPADFSGSRLAEMTPFSAPVGAFTPTAFTGAGEFAGGPQFSQARFTAPGAFVAPEMTNDPGYAFRLKQTQEALQNNAAAKGLLRNTNTAQALMSLSGDMASQEYGAAYARAKGEYDTAANLSLAAYDRNAAANRDESTINFDQRATAYGLNAQAARDIYDRNTEAGYRTNDTIYNRAASEADRNFSQGFAINEANYGRAFNEDNANFQRRFAVDEANYGRGASEADRDFSQARDVYQVNAGNRLAAYSANAQNAQAMGQLGWQIASGTYDRNYQNYATGFQVDEQRRAEAAAQAAAGASAGRAADAQAYGRAWNEYQLEYDIYRQNQADQFSRLYSMANLGQGAAATAGQFGGQYANAAGGYTTGAGNAMAAGQVGAANAWNAGLTGAGNAGLYAAGRYMDL